MDFIETIDMGSERAFASLSHLLWSKSELMADAAGRLLSLISVVETVAVSVSVSDMRIAGNPLIYVNQASVNSRSTADMRSWGAIVAFCKVWILKLRACPS